MKNKLPSAVFQVKKNSAMSCSSMLRCPRHFSRCVRVGYVRDMLDYVLRMCLAMFGTCSNTLGMRLAMSGYARLCSRYAYVLGFVRIALLESFVLFNSSILTQSWWYSVRHNTCFPEFLSVSNSVSFYYVSISWPVCISFLSLINLTLVFVRQHDICLIEFVFNTCKILKSVDVGLSTVHRWHAYSILHQNIRSFWAHSWQVHKPKRV